jgi:type VI secretion system protein
MALRLRVLGTRAERLGERSSRVFGVHGGRIGRSADNDWVLPDPSRYLSGHHALVEYRGGTWYLVDTSSNGTFVNGAAAPLGRDRSVALADGDKVRMGEYELLVSISADNDFPPDASVIAAFDAQALKESDFAIATHGDLGAELDLGRLLADPNEPPDETPEPTTPPAEPEIVLLPPPSPPPPAALQVSDAYGQSVVVPPPRAKLPPAGGAAPGAIAPSATPAVMPTIAPRAVAATARAEPAPNVPPVPANALQAFYRAAGLDPAAASSEDAATQLALAGQLLREMALGLMTALQQRAEQKQRYRVEDTGITKLEHNPFKLSASVDEALARLFTNRSARFMPPVEAVRSGFADLKKHEKATLNAMQDALAEYLARFAPGKLEEQFDAGLRRVGGQGEDKGRYWEMYQEFYRVLTQANEAGVPHAFAEEFAKAYATVTGAERMREELRKKG